MAITHLPTIEVSAETSFTLNGSPGQGVVQDDAVPANNRPLPVRMFDANGPLGTIANPLVVSDPGAALPPLGQATMANSLPVVIASDQSAIPVSQSGTWNINNVSGTVSLPTGASTAANQATANASLSSIDGKLTSPLTVQATNLDIRDLTSVSDSVAAVQSGTWNITNISGTVSLPTGAATEATLASILAVLGGTLTVQATNLDIRDLTSVSDSVSAVQSGNWSTRTQDGSGNAITSTAGALDVNVANPGGALTSVEGPYYNDYSSTSVTTAAYTQIIASTAADIQRIQIADTSGQVVILATGAAASEVDILYIGRGGDDFNIAIPSGTRLSIKALTADADIGDIVINFLG